MVRAAFPKLESTPETQSVHPTSICPPQVEQHVQSVLRHAVHSIEVFHGLQ